MTIGSGRRSLIPEENIQTAVKRHLEQGESVRVIAKHYKVSEPTIYSWIRKHKDEMLRASQSRTAQLSTAAKDGGVSSDYLDKATRSDLLALVHALREENRKVRDKLFDLMIKTDRL